MKTRTKLLIGTGAAVALVGIALATPILNLASPVLSKGNRSLPFNIAGDHPVDGGFFKVNFTTNRPSTVIVQPNAFNPGGETGWHSHPGMVIVTLQSGTVHWYDAHCNLTTYQPGDTWAEGSDVHLFRNGGATPVQAMAVFIVAEGAAARIDQPAPPCAAELGLN